MTQTSTEYINQTSRDYSIYTCESRAIPKATDGLKDAQRKALWLIRNKADKMKTVSLAGDMLKSGLYHHGDKSAADAISALAANYLNNIPLLEGRGSFGSRVNPKAIGAPRYTYVKRGKSTEKLVFVDMDIVPIQENYDGSAWEPVHFLPIVPLTLLNGISGIAVGYSTEILPRDLRDIITACKQCLKQKPVSIMVPKYTQFDMTVSHIEGNSWEFTGIIQRKDSTTVIVKSLPVEMTLEKFKSRLDELEDQAKIKSYEDRTTENIDIEIKFNRGDLKNLDDDKIIHLLKLRTRKTERITVISWNNNGIIQYENAEEYVQDFVKWRLSWYKKRYEKMKDDCEKQLPYHQAIELCFQHEFLEVVKACENKQQVLQALEIITSSLTLDGKIIDKIANVPVYRWNMEARQENLEKISELERKIVDYDEIIMNENKQIEIYDNELSELEKTTF